MPPSLIAPSISAYDRYKLALGAVEGYLRTTIIGHNPSLNAGQIADIWPGNNKSPILGLQAPVAMEIVSASAQDAALGIGARLVKITGLDADYAVVEQTIDLAGVTPVPIPQPLMRINEAIVAGVGSDHVNAGKITIRGAGGGANYVIIEKQVGMARIGWYTVPAGYRLVISFVEMALFGVSIPTPGWAKLVTYLQGAPPGGLQQQRVMFALNEGQPSKTMDIDPGFAVMSKADFAIRVADVSASGLEVSSLVVGCLVADTVWQ